MSQAMSNKDRDEDSGRFKAEYPPEEVFAAIREVGGRAATREIADYIGSSREAAYMKLQRMEERGEVESQKVGTNRMWMAPEDEEDQ